MAPGDGKEEITPFHVRRGSFVQGEVEATEEVRECQVELRICETEQHNKGQLTVHT